MSRRTERRTARAGATTVVAIAASVWTLAAGMASPGTQESKKMPDTAFGLSDGEYWSNPKKNLEALSDKMLMNDIAALTIDAPSTVVVGERESLPLLVFYSASTDDHFDAPFDDFAVVTAASVDEDVVYAGVALPRKRVPKPIVTERPSEGFAGRYFQLDARGILGLPWRPGRYVITVILRQKISNRVTVSLAAAHTTYADPEVQKFLEAQRRRLPPRTVSPRVGDPRVRYGKLPSSPPLPESVGLRLTADRVVVGRPGERAFVRASFRLPVRKTDVFAPVHGLDDNGRPRVTAVAGVTLVVVGSDSPVPWSVPLVVPSFDDVGGMPDKPVATGHFQLDMASFPAISTQPQTFFIYGFGGAEMTGPALLAIVAPEALPR